MTELRQQAIAEIQKLSNDEQDALAARILAQLSDERQWTERFAATTDEQWDRLAEEARREINAEDIAPLDEVLPPSESEQ